MAATAISTSPWPVIRMTGAGRPPALEVLNQIEAGHSGHADVRNNTVKPLSAPGAARKSCADRKAGRFNILTGEIEAQRVEHRLIVVNDRNVSENAHAWAVFAMGSVK